MSKNKKYGQLETVLISEEEYDIIHGEGYAECLKDMIKGLQDIVVHASEHDIDALEQVEALIDAASKQLNEESQSVN